MSTKKGNRKFVYKNQDSLNKTLAFYDKTLAALGVPYSEDYFETSFGKTHCLLVGDKDKPRICTIHGGNGITTLNLKLFLPLLKDFCILAPDVIGMPGKSEPYRNISSRKDEYGLWINEVLNHYNEEKISFVVSSYSSAMFLSFAWRFPERVKSALLLVPSGIAHGPILPMLGKMVVPFIKYYSKPSEKTLDAVIETMGGKGDEIWREFFDLMMSSYKMEMKPPKEYTKKELATFKSPLLIMASPNDIFFPANKVFSKAKKIFTGPVTTVEIDSKHLPSDEVMVEVCQRAKEFFEMNENLKEYLSETPSINYSHPLIEAKIKELREKSDSQIDYVRNAYEFVRDKITHSWDVKAKVVSKNAAEVLENGTGICWTKSCLLAALLRGNGIPAGISYQKLTRGDDDSDGYIIHALNTVYIPELQKWIRLDARGNKATVHAKFSLEEEKLAFPIRTQYTEIDYHDNNSDLDERLIKILNQVDVVMNIRTDFELR
ncbi:MAG: alpha/beta fold hydrolase [Treponema sp.]|nr:alpha/beta fold hydrolase [Treponema sp.]